MPGVPRELAEHKLNVKEGSRPVKQPLRRFADERRRAIGEEIARLLAAGFIIEVFHPEWLANQCLLLKRMVTGAFASILQVSTKYVQKIHLHYLASTK